VHLGKDLRTALCTAIESTVRAVGRMVVWVEAAAEDSTMSNKRWSRIDANVECPNIAGPRIESTSLAWLVLPRPMPWVPIPAKDCTEKMTRA